MRLLKNKAGLFNFENIQTSAQEDVSKASTSSKIDRSTFELQFLSCLPQLYVQFITIWILIFSLLIIGYSFVSLQTMAEHADSSFSMDEEVQGFLFSPRES